MAGAAAGRPGERAGGRAVHKVFVWGGMWWKGGAASVPVLARGDRVVRRVPVRSRNIKRFGIV